MRCRLFFVYVALWMFRAFSGLVEAPVFVEGGNYCVLNTLYKSRNMARIFNSSSIIVRKN